MNAHRRAQPPRLFNRGSQLRFCVLVRRMKLPIHQAVLARLVNLREVRALLVLLAHHLDNLIDRVGVVRVRKHMLRGVVVDRVLMPAQNIDCIAAHPHSRPQNQPLVDRFADCRVRRASALRAHVPLGRESGQQVRLRRVGGNQRSQRHRFLHRLQILRSRMQEQMHVCINQPRHQRRVAEIDDHGPLRMIHRNAHRADAVANHKHLARHEQCPGIDLKQPCRMQNNRQRPSLLGRPRHRGKHTSRAQNEVSDTQINLRHGYDYNNCRFPSNRGQRTIIEVQTPLGSSPELSFRCRKVNIGIGTMRCETK